ncbi:MAG: phospho-N-acetylmuramoyl-pentapeptide-transferase [Oscillospiraceae bacterium]
MIFKLLGDSNTRLSLLIMVLGTFAVTFFAIKYFKSILPKDQGRQFAVNGALSEGKPRGAGIILITSFVLCTALFVPIGAELLIYLLLVYAAMLTGFLDDAAEKPWGELKKGILDFAIAVAIAVNFIYHNDTEISVFGHLFDIPPVVYAVLAVILIWASINVTNCSDGVDGLCGTLFCISLYSFMSFLPFSSAFFSYACVVMLTAALAYLWFNASPSKLLMGDAGSRAMGVFLAICAMKTGRPLLFIPLCIVLILDGGLGLLKLSVRRFLGRKKFMDNIRTPLHDHMRKNKGWSDTQVVFRFAVIQIVICLAAAAFL